MNKKTFFTLAITGSNLFVLSLVFNAYLSNKKYRTHFYSSSANIQSTLEDECHERIQKVVEGKISRYICSVYSNKRNKGASYSLKTRIEIKKTGDEITIKSTGDLRDTTRHASEADFCTDCEEQKNIAVADVNMQFVMKEIVELAKHVEKRAEDSVSKAKEDFNKKRTQRNLGIKKEKECIGEWDDNAEEFNLFDEEEELDCKFRKLAVANFLDKDNFYHKKLKKELWEKILLNEDNDDLSERLAKVASNPYNYSLSIRSSASLMDSFIHWKYLFEETEKEERVGFIEQIRTEARLLTFLMNDEDKKTDLDYLAQGLAPFTGGFISTVPTTHSTPGSTIPTTPVTAPTTPDAPPATRPSWIDLEGLYQ